MQRSFAKHLIWWQLSSYHNCLANIIIWIVYTVASHLLDRLKFGSYQQQKLRLIKLPGWFEQNHFTFDVWQIISNTFGSAGYLSTTSNRYLFSIELWIGQKFKVFCTGNWVSEAPQKLHTRTKAPTGNPWGSLSEIYKDLCLVNVQMPTVTHLTVMVLYLPFYWISKSWIK